MDTDLILGIETSCDETSAAVVADGRNIKSNIISSQIDIHKRFGGVVPELASRKHTENILYVVDEAVNGANIGLADITAIGVTFSPGLVGALLVGVSAAKALAFALDIPFVGVNHLQGHLYANFLEHPELEPPFVALVVSGGHTSLIYVGGHGCFELIGQTHDDAAGEAFDKIARVMGMGYPGGPMIEKVAQSGERDAVLFPRAFAKEGFDFSFSGLKSAVINYMHKLEQRGEELNKADIAASFQWAVVDVLVEKTLRAAKKYNVNTVVLAGGVAANGALRQHMTEQADALNIKVLYPSPILCTDNAAMIACRAYYQLKQGETSPYTLNAIATGGGSWI